MTDTPAMVFRTTLGLRLYAYLGLAIATFCGVGVLFIRNVDWPTLALCEAMLTIIALTMWRLGSLRACTRGDLLEVRNFFGTRRLRRDDITEFVVDKGSLFPGPLWGSRVVYAVTSHDKWLPLWASCDQLQLRTWFLRRDRTELIDEAKKLGDWLNTSPVPVT